ncbi:MAG: sacsin N-terminal ATP-binding-like domain-containing protein [Mangrovibacterium sp.]
METLYKDKSPVDIALEEQRRESEARAILQDLERLVTTPIERRRRWVWELIQNAKDSISSVSREDGHRVNITFTLSNDRLIFTHDGAPFTLKNLLALVRRTSTKSYNNEDGNTGKFGTGFITTHALNKKAIISGLLENELGEREFCICIDRSSETLEGLQRELDNAFHTINSFYEKSPQVFEIKPLTKYEYELETENFKLAEDSLDELKKNLPFTLLINPTINSVNIIDDRAGVNVTYSIAKSIEINPGIHFSQLSNSKTDNEEALQGLLHNTINDITIAVPVEKANKGWRIRQIEKQARLYREFPLIGTEQWHIPFFVQSPEFLPSELRDGVRTLKDNENKPDKTADNNRSTFIKFKDAAIAFFKSLQAGSLEKLFLLTESGLPTEKTEYTSTDWFTRNIQKPLRDFFLSYPLLKTASGDTIAIDNGKFPQIFPDGEINELFYSIAVKYYHSQFPETESFKDWQRIVSQDITSWGNNILCSPEELVDDLNKPNGLQPLKLDESESHVQWLDHLIGFLYKIDKSGLGEIKSIYPNQEGSLNKKQEVRIDPPLNPKIKRIGIKLNQPILRHLLDNEITHRDGIDLFDTKAFFNSINKVIGELIPSDMKLNEYSAVFELISLFNDSTAKERDKWYQLAKQLLPDMVADKEVVYDMGDFNFGSAELATIKYVCWLIEKSKNFKTFSNKYFQEQDTSAYEWLNSFFDVLFRNQDYEELIRKYAVIPMQNGLFRKLENGGISRI